MLIAGSAQTQAIGAAISASVTAGEEARGYASFEAAQEAMTFIKDKRFVPNPAAHGIYDELYGIYRELHDGFGGVSEARTDFPSLMKRLLALRSRVAGNEEA
jgi:L-ribulokinase